ncbi:MAG: hypothetical protein IPK53_07435 [bacterium]|nr:hypothetical protein [bacterium]
MGADYDTSARRRQEREIAAAMHAILAVLADPLNTKALAAAHASLHELQHPAALAPKKTCRACTPSCAASTDRKRCSSPGMARM